jgi:hypothetical protein
LKPEKDSASSSQKPSLLRGLLGTLAFVSALVLSFWSKLRAPFQDSSNSTHPQDSTEKQSRICHASPIAVEIIASPEQIAAEARKQEREESKFGIEKITALLLFAYAVIAAFQWCEMRKATHATEMALELTQSPEMTVQNVDTSKPPLVVLYVTNVGNTDAANVVIQTQSLEYSSRQVMESSGFDPAVELENFRKHPQGTLDRLKAGHKSVEEFFRKMGDNETADKYRAASQKKESALLPKRIVAKISPRTVLGQQLNILPISNLKTEIYAVFVLLDWDDVFPTPKHHTNDLCFIVEGVAVSPCVSPLPAPQTK